jgi:hypothetical protein
LIIETVDTKKVAEIKDRYNIPDNLQSCHTAIVDGYIIEGHVPVEEVKRLLKERPDILGLSVPGMPAGSPGMEMPDGASEPFEVISFDKLGRTKIFATYPE